MHFRKHLLVVVVCLALDGIASLVGAVEKGDTVRFRYAGESASGKVINVRSSGAVDVEFRWNGMKITRTFPSSLVEVGTAPEKTAPPAGGGTKPAPPATGKPTSPASTDAAPREFRTWTNDTGLFKIEAQFGGIQDGKVKLIKKDKSTTLVPLEKLSEADRELANSLDADRSPFEEVGNDPAMETDNRPSPGKPNEPTSEPEEGGNTFKPIPGTSSTPVDLTDVDWSEFETLSTELFPVSEFQVEPDTGTPAKINDTPRPYLFGGRSGIRSGKSVPLKNGENPKWVRIDPTTNQALVGMVFSRGLTTPPEVRVVRINLKDGKSTVEMFPSALVPCDYHPGTQQYLFMAQSNLHPREEPWQIFGLWKQTKAKFEPVKAWSRLNLLTNEKDDRGPQSIEFAGENHAVLSWDRGAVRVWDMAQNKALYDIKRGFNAGPAAVSSNGKYLALINDKNEAVVFDLPAGEIIGKLPFKNMETLAFHPKGQYLAAASPQRVVIYDLQAGVVHRDMFLGKSLNTNRWNRDLVWLGDGYLLSGNEHLFDIERSTVLWHYDIPSWGIDPLVGTFHEGQYWYALKSRDGTEAGLFHVEMPHKAARDIASTIDPNKLVLQPGTRLKLVVNVAGTPEQQATIRDALTREVETKGMVVDDSSVMTLTAATATGRTTSQTYQFYGRIPDQTVTATEQIASLKISDGAKTVWETQSIVGGYAPFMISLQEGQSAQDYVNSLSKPDYTFFDRVEIPGRLGVIPEAGAYGFSKLTHNGIEEAAPPQQAPQGPGTGLSF